MKPHLFNRKLKALLLAPMLVLAPQMAQGAEKAVICYAAATSALVSLAKMRDFYAAEGLDVELRNFPSGRQALEAMFLGQCALATAAETPVVHFLFSRNDFRIIAAISTTNNYERIIARADRGIRNPADLRERRIAVPQFTTAHYFLDTYLLAHDLSVQSVKKVYLLPQEIGPAFRRGDVDAAAHWEPHIQKLANEFGSRATVFTAPGLHISPFLLVGDQSFLSKHPGVVEKALHALLRAERFVQDQAVTAKALITQHYSATPGEIELIWPLHEFRVSLDQSLLFLLENTARWEIGWMPPEQRPAVPNYLDFIYLKGLLAVKPEAVSIIR